MSRPIRILVLVCALMGLPPALAQTAPFSLETLTTELDQPVFVTSPPDDPRLFVVEQPGRIRVLVDGALEAEPFLDVSDRISAGGERGLLGLAFHPDYSANGRFYANYTDRDGDTQVVEYRVPDGASAADPGSARALLSVDQPFRNHNGGWIAFGPDGLLYVGMGDGGSGGDPQGNGQNPDTLLGKIVRLDVDSGGAPEIFALGVRNPWRNAFDGELLYVADVGQNQLEEISVVPLADAGANLGWNIMEGDQCFDAGECDTEGLVLPIHTYSHDEGCSITGGYVYRGSAIPEIEGRYFFADYCAGVLHSLRYADGEAAEVTRYGDFGAIGSITSFGTDSAGELYVMTQDGALTKLVPR
jgi:glucose/arabinose dehydrogenase